MQDTYSGRTSGYSRRAVLRQIGASGVSAALFQLGGVKHAFAQLDDRPWSYLRDVEARWLAAACDTLIPEDDYPSATQAGVVDFIDFQLATDYGRGARLYMQGPHDLGTPDQGYQLAFPPQMLFRRAIETLSTNAPSLSDLDVEGRLTAMQDLSERDDMLTDDIPTATFFNELLNLTNQGYFADPMYLGNHDYAGWRMVGFPGAHAYYMHSVDDHNRPYPAPPMGVAHQPGAGSSPPRAISAKR
ncbi:gluconate 2-dehydrogenase subunit 3 family protein [Roseicitreum antarcticum]|uniref:Gluconate 2-dehydrogenase gamma chain n=1 Tax=Roseicitreum antarcticum TaxID=564137 RepID=A0A1H2VG57_9RHOB|nr:gluconate 2-dehydrogenase subunit 3 family protein [Roseicitreum antarcticum]SDW67337.1 gluconate 2-dehydrogenase gamma chain [Roseicitreum antarcticum]